MTLALETERITHVAEAAEDRGRVVLQLSAAAPHTIALAAAAIVARAFQASIECVLVEDQQLIDMAGYGFVAEISFCGRRATPVSVDGRTQDMALMLAAAHRDTARVASASAVPLSARSFRGTTLEAIASACADRGPWNVVALADPIDAASADRLRFVLSGMSGATGLIAVGPAAVRTDGAIVVALEDGERLAQTLRVAERLAAETGGAVVILVIGSGLDEIGLIDGQVRLMLQDRADVAISADQPSLDSPPAIAEMLRRLRPGFVVASFGGAAVPDSAEIRSLALSLECPLFLVR